MSRSRRGEKKPSLKLQRGMRLGDAAAETDKRMIDRAFLETADYAILADEHDRRCFVIGRTGVGKSALLTRLRSEAEGRAVQINPKSLALEYITGRQVAQLADELDVNIEPLYRELWKHVIVTAVLRTKFGTWGEAEQQNRWRTLLETLRRDDKRRVAREYLEEFDGEFWLLTEDVVKNHIERVEERVRREFGASVSLPTALQIDASAAKEAGVSEEVHTERVERFKRIVGENQLARLDAVLEVLDEELLPSDKQFYVVIDNLDEEWVDAAVYNQLLMALFQTVRQLAGRNHLKVIVAVRTNILAQLDFAAPSSGQWEKYDDLTLHLRWDEEELVELLDLRVAAAIEDIGGPRDRRLIDILPGEARGRGNEKPLEFLLSRTMLRPRDALMFLNAALDYPDNDSKIKWKNLAGAEPTYSRSRLQSLFDEWKQMYPGLETVLDGFKECEYRLSRGGLEDVLFSLAASTSAGGENGWASPLLDSLARFADNLDTEEAWRGELLEIVKVLFDVGFLGLNLDDHSSGYIYSFSDPDRLEGVDQIGVKTRFEVHRAFWSALRISIPIAGIANQPEDGGI